MKKQAIINGKLVEVDSMVSTGVSSQLKGWSMDDQRATHAADILQAHKRGKPSGEFIRQYPEESKRFFSEQQIQEFGNSYE
jgi:hypothetical protein